jgi:hypothetical protein
MVLPLVAAAAVVGTGLKIAGAIAGSKAAKAQARAAAEIARLEAEVEKQRFQAMKLDSRRRMLQEFRKAQQARSLVLATAQAQGVGRGSSVVPGALSGIMGESGTNILALGQNLEIGENVFALNQKISQQKQAYAKYGGKLAEAQAIGSVGSAITNSLGSIGKLG